MGASSSPAMIERIVGVADLQVSANPAERLLTYALGSCLGIVVYDPVAVVAGMLHVMLPSGDIDSQKRQERPFMFVDSGVPMLFRACYRLGAKKERMILTVAGGAHAGPSEDTNRLQIGKRNLIALRALLLKNGVQIQDENTGGVQTSRTMWVDVKTGNVTLKINGVERQR